MTAARDFVHDQRFDQIFVLPADPASGRTTPFTIQYADYGYRNQDLPGEEVVFLFYGPLVGSRLAHIAKDELAKRHKIRIINPERPGMGGTDTVGEGDYMSLWRTAIAALLKHLEINHVALGCHSGGTVFALDMLLHHPELLHPRRPGYIAIGAPWLLPSHTGSKMMSMAGFLPAGVVGQTDKLLKVMGNHVVPVIGLSSGIFSGILNTLSQTTPQTSNESTDDQSEDVKLEEELQSEIMKRVFAANMEGVSTDAILLLQKGNYSQSGWGDWGDYDKLVPRLEQALVDAGRRLRVDIFYAEKDALIGDGGSKGPLWFDQCWKEAQEGVIDHDSTTIMGADHDDIWDLKWDAAGTAFGKMSQFANEP
ncbi:hypothetical protein JX265_007667 [Neoarthrinium moseri]|uniref:AB hydrolase-1 domain-containing protein n=1 Tax=Neoarthrinium moseri TaxID=1658444 RepID=A0A9P9WK25_9PEZI|nr:hypothetical protein JX265_007667 [Neoarthrinium moseri]